MRRRWHGHEFPHTRKRPDDARYGQGARCAQGGAEVRRAGGPRRRIPARVLRALRPVRRRLPLPSGQRRSAPYADLQAAADAQGVPARGGALCVGEEAARPRAAGAHRRGAARVVRAALRLVQPVRPLHARLPDGHRHRRPGAPRARGHGGGRLRAADLYKAAERALETGSPIGVRWPALKRQIELQEEETGLPVPVDAEGAEYMVVLSSIEIIGFAEVIGALARIFRHAGATWTMPSAGFEATNIGVQIGSREVAAELVSRIVAAAERLKVKCVGQPGMRPCLFGAALGRSQPARPALRLQGGADRRAARSLRARRPAAPARQGHAPPDLPRSLPAGAPRRPGRGAAPAR